MAPEKNNNQLQKIINRSDVSILSNSEIQLLEGAVKHILAKKDYELLIKIFSNLHNHFNRKNDIEALLKLCYQFLPIILESEKLEELGQLYKKLSILHRIKGEYEMALDFINKSYETFEFTGNSYNLSAALNSKANIHLEQGEYSLALKNYHKSYELVKHLGKTDMYYLSKHNLAGIYFTLNFFDKALELYKQDFEIVKAEKNYDRCAAILQGIAEIYSEEDRLILALKYAKRAIEYWSMTNNIRGKANAYTAYGSILTKIEKYDEAIAHIEQSIEICESYQHKRGLLQAYYQLGNTYFLIKKYEKAIKYLEDARFLAQQINLNIELKKIYSILYKAYEFVNRNEDAYITMRELVALNENYFNLNLQAKVNEVQTNFELDKKELEYYKERELSEYKNNLFSYITHEFRTPLTLIKTPIELIKSNPSEAKNIHEHTQMIENQMDKMEKLLIQMLEINKLQEGKMPINKKIGGILSMLKNTVNSFENEIQTKKIHFIHKLPKKEIHLLYDEDKVEKIIINLLSNALKYTPNLGRIYMEVSYSEQILQIKIADNGIGIPEMYQEDIFNKFYRIPSEKNITGTGLGLSFVKELVELMHGTIEVESEIEQGATFTVRLPLERIQKLKANEEDTKSTVETETKKSNVLLVEDNYEVLKLLQSIFKEDYKVSTAMNGKDALKSINKSMPDLIISDVMMPLMSGIELCNTLKKDSKFSHIPIILLSAKSQLYDKLEGLESGADAYLTKPFSLEEIKKTVSNLILQRKTIIDKFSKTIAAFSDENMVSHEILILQKASEFILENIENEDLSVNDLANHLNMSRFTLIRRFKSINNMTPNVYIQKIRLEKAKEMIKNKVASMSEIAFKVGFASSTYFTSSFKKEFGITPKDFLHLSDSEQGGTL